MTVATNTVTALTPARLRSVDAYWRAANYLTAGQIYLMEVMLNCIRHQ